MQDVSKCNLVRKDESNLDLEAALAVGCICQGSVGRMNCTVLELMSIVEPRKCVSGTVSSWMGFR